MERGSKKANHFDQLTGESTMGLQLLKSKRLKSKLLNQNRIRTESRVDLGTRSQNYNELQRLFQKADDII